MNTSHIKEFIHRNYKGWLVLLIVDLIFILIKPDYYLLYLLIFVIGVVTENSRNKDQIERARKLKTKGLTEEDIRNIRFAKKWEETRNEGLWKYCIKDGGIIAGALLSFISTTAFFVITHKNILQMFPSPGDMLKVIGYAYLSGAIAGVIIYRILWMYNERRFLRLIDPLNTIFTNKKESFNDLI
jgi:hypothetical protein